MLAFGLLFLFAHNGLFEATSIPRMRPPTTRLLGLPPAFALAFSLLGELPGEFK